MDVYKTMTSINKFGKYALMLIVLLNLVGMATAQSNNIKSAMKSLCETAQGFLGGAALVLIVLAAIVYSIGQITGAETRARASVWATAMIVGALVGLAIYLIMPPVIRVLVVGPTSVAGSGACDFV